MISVKMHVGIGGTGSIAQDLYTRTNLPDLVAFLTVLNAVPAVRRLRVYTTVELPSLHKTNVTAESLGLTTLEKLE